MFYIDKEKDLILEKKVEFPLSLIWKAWTDGHLMRPWFCPKPWELVDARITLIPGGEFYTKMKGPNGEEVESSGCYLVVSKHEKLVWTSALTKDYRPNLPSDLIFTAELHFSEVNGITNYTAIVRHPNKEMCKMHNDMGFHDGWSKALDQMIHAFKTGVIS